MNTLRTGTPERSYLAHQLADGNPARDERLQEMVALMDDPSWFYDLHFDLCADHPNPTKTYRGMINVFIKDAVIARKEELGLIPP